MFSDHDEFGRPTTGEKSWPSCPALPYTLTYDDDAGTVTTTFSPLDGGNCGFEARSDVDTYAPGNERVRVEEGGSDPRVVFSRTILETEQVCE